MLPDEKQACIEDFFLLSAQLLDTQPSLLSAKQRLSVCCFAVSAAEHYDNTSSTQYADMHWHVLTALNKPSFISACEDSEYADSHPAFGTSVCGAPFAVADWLAQGSGSGGGLRVPCWSCLRKMASLWSCPRSGRRSDPEPPHITPTHMPDAN